MCGISGYFQNKEFKNLPEDKLLKVKNILNHRGPDNFNYFKGKKFIFFHNRLSIIDLDKRSNQPMASNCGNFIIVFNGEIYNYLELKELLKTEYKFKTKSDTEVLLASFKKWGPECLNKLYGAFAFCIYDLKKDSAFFARDRFGQKPIYFWKDKQNLYFSSEIKFFKIFGYENKMDLNTWQLYLQNAQTDNSRKTFFKGVFQLLPGECMSYSNQNIKINKWYNLLENINDNKIQDKEKIINNLYDELEDAIKLNNRSDTKISISLSGGLDSNTLLSFYKNSKNLKNIPQCYSIYFEKFLVEKKLIKTTENFFNFKSNFIKINKKNWINNFNNLIEITESPIGGVMNVGLYELYQNIKKDGYKVVLDGTGLDEILGGYDVSHLIYLHQLKNKNSKLFMKVLKKFSIFNKISLENAKKKIKNFNPEIYNSIDGYRLSKEIVNDNFFEKINLKKNTDLKKDILYDHIIDYLQFTKIPRNNRLKDRASMSNSIELRLPFLEHKLVEYCLSLPKEIIFGDGSTKSILRKLMENKMSNKLRNTPKISQQSPQNLWLKSQPFKNHFNDLINSRSFKERGIFNYKKTIKEWKKFQNKKLETSFFIWQVYCTEMWCRKFLD